MELVSIPLLAFAAKPATGWTNFCWLDLPAGCMHWPNTDGTFDCGFVEVLLP